jgi:hypothetical protein
MPLHHTKDPGVSAAHIADRVVDKVWAQTHNLDKALTAGSEAYVGVLRENILEEFPPCTNEVCECYGSPARVAYSHVGCRYYCYECCNTF